MHPAGFKPAIPVTERRGHCDRLHSDLGKVKLPRRSAEAKSE